MVCGTQREFWVTNKQELRDGMKNRRLALTPNERQQKSRATATLALPLCVGRRLIAVYSPVPAELDTCPLVRELRALGIAVAYPRVVTGSRVLQFCITEASALESGFVSIMEPPCTTPVVPLVDIDVFITPALAFDECGNRLGWGQGYYDHTLAQNVHALRVGLCFQEQVVTSLPCDPTDQQMDWVVTDTKLYPGRVQDARSKDES